MINQALRSLFINTLCSAMVSRLSQFNKINIHYTLSYTKSPTLWQTKSILKRFFNFFVTLNIQKFNKNYLSKSKKHSYFFSSLNFLTIAFNFSARSTFLAFSLSCSLCSLSLCFLILRSLFRPMVTQFYQF